MKLLLLCAAVILLASEVELARPKYRKKYTVEQIFAAGNISVVPVTILELTFGDEEISPGEEISPIIAKDVPTIGFKFDVGCYYLFICVNFDWPDPSNPYLAQSIVGIYANLYGDEYDGLVISDSCVIADWIGPSPTPGTGPHRYGCYVFKQGYFIDTTDPDIAALQIDRLGFDIEVFADDYDLGIPCAGTYFLSAGCT